jgi:Mg-chelatase subunit ChlD
MGTLKRCASLAVLAVLALAVCSPLAADTRTENIDVIVALDRSLSMEKKIDAVKNYATGYLVDQVLIPGDRFIVVAFYGKTEVLVSQTIAGSGDKAAIRKTISKIRGNGRYTDIGNALDVLQQQVTPLEGNGRKKFILLLTDGIQEAPPASRYWSKDGKFNHAFLANTKTIQKKGWKIQILGIGTDTAARDLARELDGSYNEIGDTLSVDSLLAGTQGLFGTIRIDGPLAASAVAADGSSTLAFTLSSEGYKSDPTVAIESISARVGDSVTLNSLPAPFTFTVRSAGPTRVSIPVRLQPGLPAGRLPASFTFTFAAGEAFSPSEVSTTIRVRGWIGNHALLAALGVLAIAALLVLLALLIARLARGKPLLFAVLVDGEPVPPGTMSLVQGRELFLNEISGALSLVRRRNARSVARFHPLKRALRMDVLKADRFPKLEEIPPDARGKSFVLRRENGQKAALKVVSRERAK